MANYRYIDDFSIGDTYKLIRNLDSVPDDQVIVDAYWTVKPTLTTSDADAPIAIHITQTSGGTGVGEITNYEDGTVRLLFIADPATVGPLTSNQTYFYDLHINLYSGEKYALEYGKLFTGMHVRHSH